MKKKGRNILVRFSEAEADLLHGLGKDLGLSAPEIIRMCVNSEMARRTGSPEAMQALTSMFKDGVGEWVKARVDHEMKIVKKLSEKKRA